jgi:hypothetical protein
MLETEISVVLGANLSAFVFDGVATLDNPGQTQRRQTLLHVTDLPRVAPWAASVVYAELRIVLRGNFTQRDADARMRLALNIDSFT